MVNVLTPQSPIANPQSLISYNSAHVRVGHPCRGGPRNAARVRHPEADARRLAIAPSCSAASTSSTATNRSTKSSSRFRPTSPRRPAYPVSRESPCASSMAAIAAAGFGGERVRAGVAGAQASSSFTTPRGRSRRPISFYARHRSGGKRRRGDRGASGERHGEGSDGGTRPENRRADDRARVDLSGADAAGVQPRRCSKMPSSSDAQALGTATDEASLAEQAGHSVRLVDGEVDEYQNHDASRTSSVSKALAGDWGIGIGDQRNPASRDRVTTCIASSRAGRSSLAA